MEKIISASQSLSIDEAVDALSALGQNTRLAVFRLLVKAAPEGLPAGRIAKELGVAPSTLSAHLAHLEHAGLLRSERAERQIFYAVDFAGTRKLLAFLLEDCCQGQPELCGVTLPECNNC
ncbi:MAG TPA: metalloregulator ArsR/SmtB family transcription factor [Alphaproteobacteria bacterium]|jgi:predicted transcriptional regulator